MNCQRRSNWPGQAVVLLLAWLSFGLAALETAKGSPVKKDDMLRNIVREVVVPSYRELAMRVHSMRTNVEAFCAAPTADALARARESWVAALLAAREIQWLQTGPIADREYLASFFYWKVLPNRLEGVLKSTDALNAAYVDELVGSSKGMFALEYLLFDRKDQVVAGGGGTNSAVLTAFLDKDSARRRQFAITLAQDLEAKASQVAKDWEDPSEQGAASNFVAGGQESLNRIVNHIAQLSEQVAEERVNFVKVLPSPISRQFDRVEGSHSHTSQASCLAILRGLRRLYRGTQGDTLEAYLKELNAPMAERVSRHFEAAIAALKTLGEPLEDAAANNAELLQPVYEQARALEIVLKTDLPSVLGVTITFKSGDGD